MVKIDFDGNIIWQKSLGGSRFEHAANIFPTADSSFVIIGLTQSNNGDVSGNHSLSEHDSDIWIVKLSLEGELIWQQCIGGQNDEGVEFGVVKKSDFNYVIAGVTDYGPSYDVQCDPHGNIYWDYWVFEIKDTSIGISESGYEGDDITVYPNPARDYFVIEITGQNLQHAGEDFEIWIIDALGNTMSVPSGQTRIILNTKGWKKGLYFIQLKSAGKIITGKKVMVI